MPTVRKLSPEEVRTIERRIKGQRKLIEEEYDSFLREYFQGDYGEAELEPNENRITVRNRLKAAAQRRGLSLDFKRTKGNILRFHVVEGNGGAEPEPEPVAVVSSRGRPRTKKRS